MYQSTGMDSFHQGCVLTSAVEEWLTNIESMVSWWYNGCITGTCDQQVDMDIFFAKLSDPYWAADWHVQLNLGSKFWPTPMCLYIYIEQLSLRLSVESSKGNHWSWICFEICDICQTRMNCCPCSPGITLFVKFRYYLLLCPICVVSKYVCLFFTFYDTCVYT